MPAPLKRPAAAAAPKVEPAKKRPASAMAEGQDHACVCNKYIFTLLQVLIFITWHHGIRFSDEATFQCTLGS